MSPHRIDRRTGRYRMPPPGLRRLVWTFVTGDTRLAEGSFAAFAFIRGCFVILSPTYAFPPAVSEALASLMPVTVWGLTGVVPGFLQLWALAYGGVRVRRWAAMSNVGVLWMIAVMWALSIPGQLGSVAYGTLGTIQLLLAMRLAGEPE